jgi:PAS domain S-box-containing protein
MGTGQRWRRAVATLAAAYALAIALSAVAFALRPTLAGHLGADSVLVVAMPVVVLSAWVGGFGPGLLAIVLLMLGRLAWALSPEGEPLNGAYALRAAIALPSALMVCAAFEQVRRSRARAESRAEETRREALPAQHLAAALQALPISVFDMDAGLGYMDRLQLSMGLGADSMIGKRAEDLFDPDTAARLTRLRRDVLATGAPRRAEVDCRGPQGRYWMDVFVTPRFDERGAVVGLTNVAIDITEKKQREAAEHDAQRRLQRLVDSSAVAIAFSRSGVVTEANDAFLLLMGCSREDLEAGRIHQGTLVPEEERGVYAMARQELDETGRNGPFHARLRRPDGILVDVITSAGRLADNDYCIFFTDITALTRAEAALRVSGERLRSLVAEREQAMELLKQADRQKDNFIATLAHELRNPLAPIANGARLLSLKPDDPKTVSWAAQAIERQVRQLTRLLDDLLDVSRISRSVLQLQRQRMRLQDALELAAEQVRPFFEAQDHRLECVVPPEPMELMGDMARLTQVFANLLHNAAKYTPEPGLIALRAHRAGDELVVSVQDPGLGIPASEQQRVFEMFSQAHPELRSAQPGLGIGLALVKGIVEMHGGSVAVQSEGPGRGSRFTVKLPALLSDELQPLPAAAGDAVQALGGHRILVVDDNVDSAESIGVLLSQSGSLVRTAFSGHAALSLGAAFHPSVVLMDIGMPGLDGLQTAGLMRQTPWGRAAVLVAMTGYGQPEDKRRALQAGFDHHFTKPVDIDQLARCMTGPPP